MSAIIFEQVPLNVFEGAQIRKKGCLINRIELVTRGKVFHHKFPIRAKIFTTEAFGDVGTHREGKVVLVTVENVLRIVVVGRHVGRTLL